MTRRYTAHKPLKGCVSAAGPSWRGLYMVKDGRRKYRQSVTLGRIAEMSKDQALTALREIMDRDERTAKAVEIITAARRISETSWPQTIKNCDMQSRGLVSEMVVATDLLLRGFQVYRPISPTSPCDLLVMVHEWKVFRLEVKTGNTDKSGAVVADVTRNLGKFDVLAVVTEDSVVHYRAATRIQDLHYPLGKEFCPKLSISDVQPLDLKGALKQ